MTTTHISALMYELVKV